jgi:hypothetical protein
MDHTDFVEVSTKGLFERFVAQCFLRVFCAEPTAHSCPHQQTLFWYASFFVYG